MAANLGPVLVTNILVDLERLPQRPSARSAGAWFGLVYLIFAYVRSKSCSQVLPSWQISQNPEIVLPSSVKVPV